MRKIILLLLVILSVNCYSQKDKWSHGIGYGLGGSYTNQNYDHDNHYVRSHFYYTPPNQKCGGEDFRFQLALEQEVNVSHHKDDGERRRRDIGEFSFTVGGIARQFFGENDRWSVYGMIGTGIVYIDTQTLRQANGVAFMNTCAIGTSYRINNNVWVELRPSLRHISNAGFNKPNNGIDTANIEVGVFFPLTK